MERPEKIRNDTADEQETHPFLYPIARIVCLSRPVARSSQLDPIATSLPLLSQFADRDPSIDEAVA